MIFDTRDIYFIPNVWAYSSLGYRLGKKEIPVYDALLIFDIEFRDDIVFGIEFRDDIIFDIEFDEVAGR